MSVLEETKVDWRTDVYGGIGLSRDGSAPERESMGKGKLLEREDLARIFFYKRKFSNGRFTSEETRAKNAPISWFPSTNKYSHSKTALLVEGEVAGRPISESAGLVPIPPHKPKPSSSQSLERPTCHL